FPYEQAHGSARRWAGARCAQGRSSTRGPGNWPGRAAILSQKGGFFCALLAGVGRRRGPRRRRGRGKAVAGAGQSFPHERGRCERSKQTIARSLASMSAVAFDFAPLFAPGLPPPVEKWAGFPRYNFVGGHNDADQIPVERLIAAATKVLARDGRSLATYGLESGPQGYLPLRAFLAGKLQQAAGIACSTDEILITSGSLQGLDLVNGLLLAPGDTVLTEEETYAGALSRLARLGVRAVGIPVDQEGMC